MSINVFGSTPVTPSNIGFTKNAYTQTYSTAARTHTASALSESVTVALLTDVPALINSTNAAVNELKKLSNGVIDDLQTNNIAS